MIALLLACVNLGEPGPVDELACDTMARASVTVNVTDAGGAPLADATATWSLDGVDQGACDALPDASFACGYERAGRIVVTIEAEGYAPGSETVDVAMGTCHVESAVLDVALEPVACTEEERPSVALSVAGSSGEALTGVEAWWATADAPSATTPCEGDGPGWTCGSEVAGDLLVTARADGHPPITVPVTVASTDDGCHVVTESVEILLYWGADCTDDRCELSVTDIVLGVANPSDPHTIRATVGGDGSVAVEDYHLADGCCPTVAVTAWLDPGTSLVTPVYALTDDFCDCYTGLSLQYTISGLPSGTYTLGSADAETTFTVPG